MEPASITVDLDDPDDTPEELRFAQTIQDLVNGTVAPARAAAIIDTIITQDCISAQEALNSRHSEDGPAPGGWQKMLWDYLATSAMMTPAAHPGQDHLATFFLELKQLPRHKVPTRYEDPVRIEEKELWVLTRRNGYDYFAQWMWERHEGEFAGWRQIEEDLKAAERYINFSSFLARLLANGGASVIQLSALLPFIRRNLKIAATDHPEKFEVYVVAAAQWILYAGSTLFEMCQRKVLEGIRWKSELWDRIKKKLDSVSSEERFSEVTRDWALQAVGKMMNIEDNKREVRIQQETIVNAHEFLQVWGPDDSD